MLALKVALLFLAGLLNIAFGLLVLARDVKKINNISFAVLCFSISGWALGIAAFLFTRDPSIAFVWAKVYYLFPLLIAGSLTVFALSFPLRDVAKIWVLIILAGFLALAIPLIADRTFVTERLVYYPWGKDIILNLRDYLLYSMYLLGCFGISLRIVYKRSKLTGLYGIQAFIFFVGFLSGAIFGVLFNLILPGLGNYKLIWLGPLFTTLFAFSIAYSIIRHKMFDIRLAVARTLGYAGSLIVLSSIYGFLVFGAAAYVFNLHFPITTQVFISAATGLAALFFSRLRGFFDQITNRVFYRDAYDPQVLFDRLNRILISTLDLDRLLKESSTLIAESLKAQYCTIALKRENQQFRFAGSGRTGITVEDITAVRHLARQLHTSIIATDYLEETSGKLKELLVKNNIAALARLSPHAHTAEEGLGYIVLGVRKSGNPYTKQDFRVLDTVAKELILAIQNAMHFEEIQHFNITLQGKVDEATRKLRRANERLKTLDETKDDFISMASHQLRTPLTSVKGYISMVLEGDAGKISPTQKKLLTQSFFSSQRMVYLIADLLNVSRLRTGKFVIDPTPVNLAEVVEQELEQLKETAASHSLKLTYQKPKHFPELMLDETKTRQVIMNFVDNAIYYTPSGGHINARLVDNPTSVELRVEDNGIGVPVSEKPHMFTKFYRAGNARKARPDGTGLGLFMAKKVIVAQGGSIIFESQEGKGSTFGFIFSKAKHAVPATSKPKSQTPPAAVKS